MSIVDALGWVAAALVVTTFYLKTMIPLRWVAIASNVAFAGYGLMAGAIPIVALHLLLLPLNATRLYQMRLLIRRVKRAARGTLSLDMLVPYMKVRRVPDGTRLFEMGDHSDEVFLVLGGRVRIVGKDAFVKTGQLVGEMGIFTPERRRTDAAVCDGEVELASISEDKVWELFYQNPEFGAYLLRLIMQRAQRAVPLESIPAPAAPRVPIRASMRPASS